MHPNTDHKKLRSFPTRRSSDLLEPKRVELLHEAIPTATIIGALVNSAARNAEILSRDLRAAARTLGLELQDRKSTRLNSSHLGISYAVFCLKKKTKKKQL